MKERISSSITQGSKRTDPFVTYGPGIYNYFKLMENLLCLFFVLSILAVAQMFIYRKFDGLGYLDEYVTFTADYSFGNMGFPTDVCSKMPLDWRNDDYVDLSIGCQQTT